MEIYLNHNGAGLCPFSQTACIASSFIPNTDNSNMVLFFHLIRVESLTRFDAPFVLNDQLIKERYWSENVLSRIFVTEICQLKIQYADYLVANLIMKNWEICTLKNEPLLELS